MDETTSRHLRNASEVLLWIPIKNEFAHFDEQIVSYASRLSLFLQGVFELRRDSTERRGLDTAGPVERLQVVYNVQWTVLEEERRLLVAASFDRSWETYFRELADTTGSLLDAIFCHCEGFEKNTCADSFETFMIWIRKYQRPCDFFFSAAPDLTTDDLRYLKQLSRVAEPGLLSADTIASRIMLKPPGETAPHAQPENIEKALWGLYDLRKLFTADVMLGVRLPRSEEMIFDGAMSALFVTEKDGLADAINGLVEQRGAAQEALKLDPKSLAMQAAWKDLNTLIQWASSLADHEPKRIEGLTAPIEVDCDDEETLGRDHLKSIQGGILTDYPGTTHGVMALIQCDTRASWCGFLDFMQTQVTTELDRRERGDSVEGPWVNLGLTYRGLERSGLPESVLLQFPKEFREGMEARAGLLGDVGDPDYPLETGPVLKDSPAGARIRMSAVDAIVLVQSRCDGLTNQDLTWWTKGPNPFRSWLAKLEKLPGVRVLSEQPLQRQFEDKAVREHFGFVEGEKRSSQPVPRVKIDGVCGARSAHEGVAKRDRVRLGEILLGYKNDRGEPARSLKLQRGGKDRELLSNGSFMVVRKLRQDVTAFRNFVATRAKHLDVTTDDFKALIAGRRAHDGESLIASRSEHLNDFDFSRDSDGVSCPHFSHIRRTNPRARGQATLVPRLLRRGFSYGPACPERETADVKAAGESEERGLVFMAYNASIAEQFEVIQRWINGGNRTGLLSSQQDILAGQGPVSQAAYWHRASDDPKLDKQFAPPVTPLVSLHWGAYLFVPSLAAMRELHELAGSSPQFDARASAERGDEIVARLRDLERSHPDEASAAWKKVLEEPLSSSDAADVWQAIRLNHDGALRTAYGVLIAKLDRAVTVLRDDGSKYSVREYHERLGTMIGGHYLGMDRKDPEYARLAKDPNDYAHTQIRPDDAFVLARTFAEAALRGAHSVRGRQEIHLRRLGEIVVLQLCHEWFELEIDPEQLNALVFTSRYAFQVSPGDGVRARIKDQLAHIPRTRDIAKSPNTKLREYLRLQKRTHENEVALALNGAIVGFAAPAIASVVTILDAWAANGELWRLAAAILAEPIEDLTDAHQVLLAPVLAALRRKPVPSLLYRMVEDPARAELSAWCREEVEQGSKVIVGLGAIYDDAVEHDVDRPEQWLFGGEYTGETIRGPVKAAGAERNAGTAHGCPARDAALAALVGVFSAVLSQATLRLERRFVVSYSAPDVNTGVVQKPGVQAPPPAAESTN